MEIYNFDGKQFASDIGHRPHHHPVPVEGVEAACAVALKTVVVRDE